MAYTTVTEIAEYLGVSRRKVDYIIRSRGIQHAQRVGLARVYSKNQIKLISNQLAKIEAGKGGAA